jgi:hypothetical protein
VITNKECYWSRENYLKVMDFLDGQGPNSCHRISCVDKKIDYVHVPASKHSLHLSNIWYRSFYYLCTIRHEIEIEFPYLVVVAVQFQVEVSLLPFFTSNKLLVSVTRCFLKKPPILSKFSPKWKLAKEECLSEGITGQNFGI